MRTDIAIAIACVVAVPWLLRRFPNNPITRASLTRFGLKPILSETWAHYQLRLAGYCLGCLGIIALLFVGLALVVELAPQWKDHGALIACMFAFSIVGGMAALAFLSFLVVAAKAAWLGPNPQWNPAEVESIDV